MTHGACRRGQRCRGLDAMCCRLTETGERLDGSRRAGSSWSSCLLLFVQLVDGGVDLDADAVGSALDEDARHGGLLELLHQRGADDLVLVEELGEILLAREPA